MCMLRWLAVAALGAAFLTVPAWGQRRGGGSMGHGGFAAHGSGFSSHGSGMMSRGIGASSFHSGAGWGSSRGWHGPYAGNRGYYGYRSYGRYFRRGYYGGYPWYGWYGDPGWYNDYSDNQPPYPGDDYSSGYDPGDAAMQAQQAEIDRLHNQLDNARGGSQRTSAASQSKDDSQPTELVFRDKHTEEVQNYAIVGGTLYDLTDGHRRKIPLASLDLTATAKQNDDRGVDFQVPRGTEVN